MLTLQRYVLGQRDPLEDTFSNDTYLTIWGQKKLQTGSYSVEPKLILAHSSLPTDTSAEQTATLACM